MVMIYKCNNQQTNHDQSKLPINMCEYTNNDLHHYEADDEDCYSSDEDTGARVYPSMDMKESKEQIHTNDYASYYNNDLRNQYNIVYFTNDDDHHHHRQDLYDHRINKVSMTSSIYPVDSGMSTNDEEDEEDEEDEWEENENELLQEMMKSTTDHPQVYNRYRSIYNNIDIESISPTPPQLIRSYNLLR